MKTNPKRKKKTMASQNISAIHPGTTNLERMPELTKEDELFWEREVRTTEAESMLALVSRVISEDAEQDGKMLNQTERYGLSYICDIALKNIKENAAALCDCHERKQKEKQK